MASAINIQTSGFSCPGDMLPCGLPGTLVGGPQGFGDFYLLQKACFDVHEPGSPQVEDLRCTGSLGSRMQADVRMLSGSKRSCEGHSSLQDEAEADDASMMSCRGSGMMCRSGSVRSFGIKRVCSIARADALDSHCPTAYQQQQTSVMIPVPGSTSSQATPASSPATAGPTKRSSKTGSSSISSQEHSGTTALARSASVQEVGSAAGVSGRKLAPIRTSVAPRVPRMRLNGRLLSPEEAQKHLAAVAAAAAAATASRSLSRAQSPAPTCPGRSSPAGPYSSSMSLSAGNAPCNSAGNSSGMCWTTSKLALTAAGPNAAGVAAAVQAGKAMYVPAAATGTVLGGSRVLSALDVLPENFIPTPEGNWHSLASTLEDGCCAATSERCASPLVCSSYTELLLTEEASTAALPPAAATARKAGTFRGPQSTAPMLARLSANTGESAGVSAFAAPSAVPWGMQQQQPGMGHSIMLQSAGSVSDPASLELSSSCPVRIPMHNGGSWNSSKLLTGSVSGSSGNSTLATSLAHQGSNAATDTECAELLSAWGAPQQQMHAQQQGLVTFSSLASGSAGGFVPSAAWGKTSSAPAAVGASRPAAMTAWKPAFVPAFTSADTLARGSSTAGMITTNMVPTPGLTAVGSAPALSNLALLQQQRVPMQKTKGTTSRTKKHSKSSAGSKGASHGQQVQMPQQMVAVLDGGQQVVLSQHDLMAVLQQNMAASFASGYMMASSMQGSTPGGPSQVQMQPKPPLLKPVASLGAFVMPPAAVNIESEAAVVTAGVLGGGRGSSGVLSASRGASAAASPGLQSGAAAAAALGSSTDMQGLVVIHGVDDILPSLQELLTDCC